jgi:hypothetical protein
MAHDVLHVLLCNLGRDSVLFRYRSEGKEKHHSLNPKKSAFFFLSGARKKMRRQQLIV